MIHKAGTISSTLHKKFFLWNRNGHPKIMNVV